MHKRRALIDVDGVLADFVGGSKPIIERLLGRKTTEADFMRWDVTVCLKEPDLKKQFDDAIDSPGFCTSLKPYPGAQDGIESIREIGYEVVFVTSHRLTSPTWVHERDAWLKKHFRASSYDMVHCMRKEFVCGDFILDDRPRTVATWAEYHTKSKAYLWHQAYNAYADEEHPGLNRISSWGQLILAVR